MVSVQKDSCVREIYEGFQLEVFLKSGWEIVKEAGEVSVCARHPEDKTSIEIRIPEDEASAEIRTPEAGKEKPGRR